MPKFFDSILDFVETDDSFLLTSVKCAPLPYQLRSDVASILLANRVPQLVFAGNGAIIENWTSNAKSTVD